MKILVTGISGQLGYDTEQELSRRNISHLGVSSMQMDLLNPDQIKQVIFSYHPDAVIHCAAYTNVDKAEEEQELCRQVNTEGTRQIALACAEIGSTLMYISTDYVFDGRKDAPYETDDKTHPLNMYGKTKLDGELAVKKYTDKFFVVRTSWAFGIHGNNFVKSIMRAAQTKSMLKVVDDQVGSPTYTKDLAQLLCDMIVTDKYGIYHATNEGFCSRAKFAEEIIRLAGLDTKVQPIPSSLLTAPACRPLNSRLSKEKLSHFGFRHLREWNEALREYMEILTKEESAQ